MGGTPFPLVRQVAVAALAGEHIPLSPTHVVIAPTEVRVAEPESGLRGSGAQGAAEVIERLDSGRMVRVLQAEDGWALVAREGKRLGYVPLSALVELKD